jgi:hypothetical protein
MQNGRIDWRSCSLRWIENSQANFVFAGVAKRSDHFRPPDEPEIRPGTSPERIWGTDTRRDETRGAADAGLCDLTRADLRKRHAIRVLYGRREFPTYVGLAS